MNIIALNIGAIVTREANKINKSKTMKSNSKKITPDDQDTTLNPGEVILSPEQVDQKFQQSKAARIKGAESKEKEVLDEVEIALKKYGKTAKGRAIFGDEEEEIEGLGEEFSDAEFEEMLA